MLTGSLVAIVTPMLPDGALDFARLKTLIDWHIAEGTDGIVIVGTTGESPTVDFDEHRTLIKKAVEYIGKRVPLIAGTGGNSTKEAIHLTEFAKLAGADYALSVVPYYNKPTQEGLFQHYKALSNTTNLPIIVYSVQGRTGVNVEPATLTRLSELSNIVAVKEASGNISQIARIVHEVPQKFHVLSGDDSMTIPVVALGGKGIISVVSNQIPGEMTQMTRLALQGDFVGARALQRKFLPLMEMNFIEPNPQPVKAAMAYMGLLKPVWRLPMTPPSQQTMQAIEKVLSGLNMMAQRSSHVAG